ncbi:MAG: CPBP family intramembrane glutamic endopeptidase [Verrucomicrobiota bacterium]
MMNSTTESSYQGVVRRYVMPALGIPFVAALFYFLIIKDQAVSRLVYIATKVFLVAWPLGVYFLALRNAPRPMKREGTGRGRAVMLGIISGIALAALIYAAMHTPLGKMAEASAGSIRERTEHLGILEWYWIFSVFLSVVHSLIEEFYWRWFSFGLLNKVYAPAFAIALSSLAFASHHVIITGQFFNWPLGILCGAGIAAGGAVWAWLYHRTGSLLAPWISHAIVDFAVMAIGYRILMMV